MQRTVGVFLLLIGVAGLALAVPNPPVPEIDAGSAVNVLALASGALLVIRGRKKA